MAKKINWNENLSVPFNEDGMMGYDDGPWRLKYVDNHIMELSLKIQHFVRGRSSAKLHLIDVNTNLKYEMFLTDLEDMLKMGVITQGNINGKFAFTKRGKNYGIKLIEQTK